ncbi:hypothetical protein ACN38_g4582 [Penicillium nordicum]|uniref:Uncharacterized protein n=1 Tax=Penicillium nordicum TaxID=229535 RepID=A0A0M8P363_9EURO|nr:hypothetical protein ACN38_g4582 [Penicillium nordicum]
MATSKVYAERTLCCVEEGTRGIRAVTSSEKSFPLSTTHISCSHHASPTIFVIRAWKSSLFFFFWKQNQRLRMADSDGPRLFCHFCDLPNHTEANCRRSLQDYCEGGYVFILSARHTAPFEAERRKRVCYAIFHNTLPKSSLVSLHSHFTLTSLLLHSRFFLASSFFTQECCKGGYVFILSARHTAPFEAERPKRVCHAVVHDTLPKSSLSILSHFTLTSFSLLPFSRYSVALLLIDEWQVSTAKTAAKEAATATTTTLAAGAIVDGASGKEE